jgi:hypothetical protein
VTPQVATAVSADLSGSAGRACSSTGVQWRIIVRASCIATDVERSFQTLQHTRGALQQGALALPVEGRRQLWTLCQEVTG